MRRRRPSFAAADSPVLLVLDNCEHLVSGAARAVEAMLRACPILRVLATSREPLKAEGEQVYRVLPLPVPEEDGQRLADLRRLDSVRLFVERALATDAAFELTEGNARAVTEICRRLDGIPLALELAAACVASMSAERIRQRLGQGFDLLMEGRRTAVGRQRTLRAAVEWSERLLSESERQLFHRLGVFVRGFDLPAAEAMATGPDLPASEVLPLLRRLVERSLVSFSRDGGERYRLLETVREFALECLNSSGHAEAARMAHAEHYTKMAKRAFDAYLTGTIDPSLSEDLPNFRAALEYSSSAGASCFPALAAALRPLWLGELRIEEGVRWTEAALSSQPADQGIASDLLLNLGTLATALGQAEDGSNYLEQSLRSFRRAEDRFGEIQALLNLASAKWIAGDLQSALRCSRDAVDLARKLDERHRLVSALSGLAMTLIWLGDVDAGAAVAKEALAYTNAGSGPLLIASARHALVLAHLQRGELETAWLLQGDTIRGEEPVVQWQVIDLATAAALLVARGRPERALTLVGAIDANCRRLGFDPRRPFTWQKTWIESAESKLGERANALRRARQHMSLEDARIYALDETEAQVEPGRRLTRRELEVGRLVREGLTNRQIASRLFISERTAEYHLEQIRNKLGMTSRIEIANWVGEQLPDKGEGL